MFDIVGEIFLFKIKRLGGPAAAPNFLYINQEVSLAAPLCVRSFSVTHFFFKDIKRLLRTVRVMDEVFRGAHNAYYVKFILDEVHRVTY